MKLGLKVNADRESADRLNGAGPPFVEVWFNVNEKDRYDDLFRELQRRQCQAGLHFWGLLDGNIAPNIAYPDEKVIKESMTLMRQTIDIAARHNCAYVNIHPGASALSKVQYDKERYDVISDPADTDRSIDLFLEHAIELHEYATSKNVVFTVETVPPRITDGWYNATARLRPKNAYELPPRAITRACDAGLWVANDFCHTAANAITDNPDVVFTFLKGITLQLAPKTRLIHLGFVMPPYNGTDNHDELDNPLLQTNQAVPNHHQMIELLRMFQNRDDVWILVEPKEDHVKNYFLAKQLLDEAFGARDR
ncbi:MAG TPA: TIM barrel protein [Patescibacteria group bacterium]|nr:TIM barrel protein [Patescibacteria group bacterium]